MKQFEITDSVRDDMACRRSLETLYPKSDVDLYEDIMAGLAYGAALGKEKFYDVAVPAKKMAKELSRLKPNEKVFDFSSWDKSEAVQTLRTRASSIYLSEKKPFYRCYPSFVDQAVKLFATNKFEYCQVLDGMHLDGSTTVALELQESASLWYVADADRGVVLGFIPMGDGKICFVPLSRIKENIADHLDSFDILPLVKRHIIAFLAAIICRDDPEIAKTVVLSHFNDEVNERTIRISRQRGVNGVEFGKILETTPSAHYRRPHLALYHVGKGRTDTKIILRKG